MRDSVEDLKVAKREFEQWHPHVEERVLDLQSSVANLQLQIEKLVVLGAGVSSSEPGKATAPEKALISADLEIPSTEATPGQISHCKDLRHRGSGTRVPNAPEPPPVKGTGKFANISPVPFSGFGSVAPSVYSQSSNYNHAVPPLEFPRFDGSNPKIWIKKCENYFDICAINPEHQVKLAVMFMIGTAAFWLQTIEMDLKKCSWPVLCHAVIERFERDQYNHVIRQFFHINQSGSVAEYVEQFDELVHQILAHDPYFSTSVTTSQFVDGLKSEIKSVVLVHRPKDLETASSLALLQEEVLLGQPSRDWRKNDEFAYGKQAQKNSNTTIASRSTTPPTTEGRRFVGNSKNKNQDEKLAALMAYRKAKGLCYKCGMK